MKCPIPLKELYDYCGLLQHYHEVDDGNYEYGISVNDWFDTMHGYRLNEVEKAVEDWWEKLKREEKLEHIGKYIRELIYQKDSICSKLTELAIYENQFYDE